MSSGSTRSESKSEATKRGIDSTVQTGASFALPGAPSDVDEEQRSSTSQTPVASLITLEQLQRYTAKNATAFELSARRSAFIEALHSERDKIINFGEQTFKRNTWNVLHDDACGEGRRVHTASEEATRAYEAIRKNLASKIAEWTDSDLLVSVFDPSAHDTCSEKCAACASIVPNFLVPAADLGSMALSLRQAVRGSAFEYEDTFIDKLSECVSLIDGVQQVVHPKVDHVIHTKLIDDTQFDEQHISDDVFAQYKSVTMGTICGKEVESILAAAQSERHAEELRQLGFDSPAAKLAAVTEACARYRLGMMTIMSKSSDSQIPFYQITDLFALSKACDEICTEYKDQIDEPTQPGPSSPSCDSPVDQGEGVIDIASSN